MLDNIQLPHLIITDQNHQRVDYKYLVRYRVMNLYTVFVEQKITVAYFVFFFYFTLFFFNFAADCILSYYYFEYRMINFVSNVFILQIGCFYS